MKWIAPNENDIASDALEKRLWAAADQLRANSGLVVTLASAAVAREREVGAGAPPPRHSEEHPATAAIIASTPASAIDPSLQCSAKLAVSLLSLRETHCADALARWMWSTHAARY